MYCWASLGGAAVASQHPAFSTTPLDPTHTANAATTFVRPTLGSATEWLPELMVDANMAHKNVTVTRLQVVGDDGNRLAAYNLG